MCRLCGSYHVLPMKVVFEDHVLLMRVVLLWVTLQQVALHYG